MFFVKRNICMIYIQAVNPPNFHPMYNFPCMCRSLPGGGGRAELLLKVQHRSLLGGEEFLGQLSLDLDQACPTNPYLYILTVCYLV